jgi:5-methylcytosine-specific restriction endonuclease McrA
MPSHPKPEPRKKKEKKRLKRSWIKHSKKSLKKRQEDKLKRDAYYAEVIRTKSHVCENCGAPIPDPAGHNVSHIVSAGNNEALYYDPDNNFLLCLDCEGIWTGKSPHSMRIWPEAERRITMLNHRYYVENPKILYRPNS